MDEYGVTLTAKMREAGEAMAGYCMDAQIKKALGSDRLGGCEEFNIQDFPEEFQRLIQMYVDDEISSVEAIYVAMRLALHNN